ncbi:MAG: hypothetical protein ACREL9_02780 [Gemmatimonadales bacterium]
MLLAVDTPPTPFVRRAMATHAGAFAVVMSVASLLFLGVVLLILARFTFPLRRHRT